MEGDYHGPGRAWLWVKRGAVDAGDGWGRIGLLRIRIEREEWRMTLGFGVDRVICKLHGAGILSGLLTALCQSLGLLLACSRCSMLVWSW